MSNYTPLVNFASKDGLPSGNPLKLVKGAELTGEFSAIAAAIATKFDGTLVYAPDGTAVQPSFGFTNNAGTGMFNAAGVLGFATSGLSRVSISGTGSATIGPPSSGTTLTVNGIAGQFVSFVVGANSVGNSFGQVIQAGTNSTDTNCLWVNATNSVQFAKIFGDGGMTLGSPTGGNQGLGTLNATNVFINGAALQTAASIAATYLTSATAAATYQPLGSAVTTGTFTAGTTGLSGATSSCKWTKVGNTVTMFMGLPSTLVSNSAVFTLTGLPAAIQPATAKYAACSPLILNGGSTTTSGSALVSGSTISFQDNGSTWTATGNKNFGDAVTGTTFVWDTN